MTTEAFDEVTSEYASFRSFMEQLILPRQSAHPGDIRLDGQPTGGNRQVVGRFWHGGRRWKVHGDTHYRPLLIAYEALKSGELTDPFVETHTRGGTPLALDLVPALRARMGDRDKYLYIYEA